jgi:transcriptional regulator with XRE-family HTH domain
MKTLPKITIGDNLKLIRKSRKITLSEISKRTGIQLATLSRLQNNLMTGTIESHVAIAEALGIRFIDLYKQPTEVAVVNKKSSSVEIKFSNWQECYKLLKKRTSSKKTLSLVIKITPQEEDKFLKGEISIT